MPDLGTSTLAVTDSQQNADNSTSVILVLSVDVNSAQGFSVNFARPATLNQPKVVIERITGRGFNAQTAHPIVAQDGVSLQIVSNDGNVQRTGFITAPYYDCGLSAAVGDGEQRFSVSWPFHDRLWRSGELIRVRSGPIDDGGAPTGDFEITVTVRILTT